MLESSLGAIVIDCENADLDEAAAFWSQVFHREARRYADPADANYVCLVPPAGEPLMLLQNVDHPSRVHLDIETDDVEAEVARLKELGAHEDRRLRDFVIMLAPTGHRFCVVPVGDADT